MWIANLFLFCSLVAVLYANPKDPIPKVKSNAPIVKPIATLSQVAFLPENFDAREHWPACASIISRVHNQFPACEGAWAMASTGVISDRICIASSGRVQKQISVWNLMTCCGVGYCADGVTQKGGCKSGNPIGVWRYFTEKGLVTEDCVPQPSWLRWWNGPFDKKECNHEPCNQKEIFYGKSYYRLPKQETTIRKEIFDHGPVVAQIDALKLLRDDHDGSRVFKCPSTLGEINHSIRLIGWGVQNGTEYWLAVNSWGDSWGGDGGVFKLGRGENSCGVEQYVSAPIPAVEPKNSNRIH